MRIPSTQLTSTHFIYSDPIEMRPRPRMAITFHATVEDRTTSRALASRAHVAPSQVPMLAGAVRVSPMDATAHLKALIGVPSAVRPSDNPTRENDSSTLRIDAGAEGGGSPIPDVTVKVHIEPGCAAWIGMQ